MRTNFILTAALMAILSGCAINPGMSMHNQVPDSVANPTIKEITPDLIRAENQARAETLQSHLAKLFSVPMPYQLGVGDVLGIDFPEQSLGSLSEGPTTAITPMTTAMLIANNASDGIPISGYSVDQQGYIHPPFIDAIKADGLSLYDVQTQLNKSYAKIIKKPNLNIRILAYRSQRIYVEGEVKSPGVLPLLDIPMSLSEAINRAGGATTNGDTGDITLDRGGNIYQINIPELLRHHASPSKIMLQSGDTVRIPPREENKIFVVGGITNATQSAQLMHNGNMTLNEALGSAGGIGTGIGDGKRVFVVRNAEDMTPIVYHLDAGSPVALVLAENFQLKPKDVVFVDNNSLVMWNQVMSLILPTATMLVNAKYLNIIK